MRDDQSHDARARVELLVPMRQEILSKDPGVICGHGTMPAGGESQVVRHKVREVEIAHGDATRGFDSSDGVGFAVAANDLHAESRRRTPENQAPRRAGLDEHMRRVSVDGRGHQQSSFLVHDGHLRHGLQLALAGGTRGHPRRVDCGDAQRHCRNQSVTR